MKSGLEVEVATDHSLPPCPRWGASHPTLARLGPVTSSPRRGLGVVCRQRSTGLQSKGLNSHKEQNCDVFGVGVGHGGFLSLEKESGWGKGEGVRLAQLSPV